MSRLCPYCGSSTSNILSYGTFIRSSDKKRIQRFKCRLCLRSFSKATFHLCYRQKKRILNKRIFELLCSGMSQRRIAIYLKITRKTVSQKFIFLARFVREKNIKSFNQLEKIDHLQFDDLETIEHTKCKPLSVTMAVEKHTRKILLFKVSQMPAKGRLSEISRKKYGRRIDKRYLGRREVFLRLSQKLCEGALIESDENPHYAKDIKRFFPKAEYRTFLSKRSSIAGQGELKKVVFDPLFSINHTFAMLRANINRLFRKTWCTTKLPARLTDHLELYVYFHNNVLLKKVG